MGMEIQWHLLEGDFFSGLAEEKREFISLAALRLLDKKEMIFQKGEPGGSAFYLEEGQIRIFRVSYGGKETIVSLRNRGEMFGLAEFMGEQERIFNAQAITPCRLYEVKKRDFEGLLQRHFPLAKRVIEILGGRVRYLGEQMESLMISDVSVRLLKMLVCLGCHGLADVHRQDQPIPLSVKLTQEQLASMIGSSQQTISETLKRLREERLIDVAGKELTLLRPQEIFERILA